jgi:hypothetical protein
MLLIARRILTMNRLILTLLLVPSTVVVGRTAIAAEPAAVKEVKLAGPLGVTFNLRMEGPYTADVPLQVVCYFRYTTEAAAKMKGAPVELDKQIGGVIAALRRRGEFTGDPLETLVIVPPSGTIPAKALLLIGLGNRENVSLELMERVGRTALREASRLGVDRAAFAPLLRDQGDASLDVGEVERAVVRGVLLAYDTEMRLQKEGFARPFTLKEWNVEAGPAYFDATKGGLEKGIVEAETGIAARTGAPYRSN